jgi:Family of unknown function (DUF6644)
MLFLQANPVSEALNSAEWIFPTMECFHLVGFGIAVGSIALVDLSLLGLGFGRKATSQVYRDVAPFTLAALLIVIMAGSVLFLTDPLHYLENHSFRFKMACLLLAIVFNYTIHRKVALSGKTPRTANVLVAIVSVLLWASIVAGGLAIAFVG